MISYRLYNEDKLHENVSIDWLKTHKWRVYSIILVEEISIYKTFIKIIGPISLIHVQTSV